LLTGNTTSGRALLAFLRAELDSPTESERLRRSLEDLGLSEGIILDANVEDPVEHDARWRLFDTYRGSEAVFDGLEWNGTTWHWAALSEEHLRDRVKTCRNHFEERFDTREPALVAVILNRREPSEPNPVIARVVAKRAPSFGMHGLEQADRAVKRHGQRKFSLWTGDLGLATFLCDCIRGCDQFPTLDVF
jgi:hypothetical protein